MAEFDMDAYLRRRPFNPNSTDRLQGLEEASQAKIKALTQYSQERQAQNLANKDSWSNKVGIDSNSFEGKAINLAASLVSGASRDLGNVVALTPNALAYGDEAMLSQAHFDAGTRLSQGVATPEDMTLLNSKLAPVSQRDHPLVREQAQRMADANPDAPTVLDVLTRTGALRAGAKAVVEKFDNKQIVHQGNREKLTTALTDGFTPAWDQTKDGWESLKKGEDGKGLSDIVQGLGSLLYTAGEAAINHPSASAEYVFENLPQLAVGLLGKAGKATMSASNAGYGADLYRQGIANYQKENDGAFPPEDVRQKMAANAAGAVLMEQAGDVVGLGLMKAGGKAGTDAVRTGFKESLKNTTRATMGGVASESVTEGVQTHLEGEATLKAASAKDIYVGATIGGIAGGGLSGGGRAVAELVGATPEKAAKRAEDQAATETFIEHAKTNNADFYLDEKSKDYNPPKGVAVLFANSQAADTTPETKQQNVERAHDIIAGLESKRQDLQNQLDQMTPEGIQARIDGYKERLDTAPPELASRIQDTVNNLQEGLTNFDPKSIDQKEVKSLKTQLASLDRQIGESTKLRDEMAVLNAPKEADIEAAVETADKVVDTSTPEIDGAAKGAVAHVVSLAMSHPDSFSDDHLNRLVSNQSNGLSAQQRTYLRSVSESRIADNAMKTLGIVENEVMKGDPSKNQLGIADYKQRMDAAVKSRDEEKAATALHMLSKFADAHQQKLDTFLPLFNKVGKRGSFNVVPTKQGWQLAPTQDVSLAGQQANRKLGGLTISAKSSKLIGNLRAESGALNASRAQLKAVYDLRFTPQKQQTPVPPVAQTTLNQSGSSEAVNSVNPSTAQAAPEQTAVEPVVIESNTASNQFNVDSTVDSQAPSTKARKPRQRIEPKDYQNIVGALLQVTGGEGISSKVARDLLGDKTKELKSIRPAVRANGWQDVGQLIEYLREAGYTQLNTEADLVAMLQDHMNGIPGRTAAQVEEEAALSEERKAKEEERSFRKAVNQEAKEKGIKTARGKRTIEQVLADLQHWEEQRSAMEAAEEREAILAEAAFAEAVAAGLTEAEAMQQLADIVGYTQEEIENADHTESRKTEEVSTQVSQGEAQADRGGREDDRQAEAGENADRESGKLSVFQEVADTAGKKFSEVFKSINLIAHNLVQKAGKEGSTQRPLVAARDFLSGWLDGSIDDKALATFIGAEPIGVQQTFLNHFKVTAKQWLPVITKNLVQGQVVVGKEYKKAIKNANQIRDPKARKDELARIEKDFEGKKPGQIQFNPDLKYTNPIQYLISLDENDKANTEENIKTAIAAAAFMYVAENAKAPQMSSPESVKAMFGLGEYDTIGDKLLNTVAPLGNPEKTVIISMGQRVTQALGLAAKNEATQDFLARLEADLGAHVMKLLVDQKVMQRTVVPRTVISDGLKHLEKHDASKQGSMAFLRMVRSPGKKLKDRKLNPVAEAISSNAVGTKGILGKLFGVEAQVKEPSWEPIKVSQTTTANTDQAIPDELKKIVVHENSVANYVREDVWTLLQGLGEEAFLEMAGYIEIDESAMHKFSIQSVEVSNEALIRELSAAVSYFSSLENSVDEGGSPLKLKQPLYLAHSIWKQQRVGIDGVINPQSSKIHRWMLTRKDWKTDVSSTDLDSFMLRVAEGLGVKTDKQDNSRSLTAAKELFNTESKDSNTQKRAVILQAAVDALIASRQPGAEMSAAQQKAIVVGVKAGGEKMHSMDALIAMANYQEAKTNSEGKSFTFEVQMMGEVDGVTNGPMLSHLALGAAADATTLLNRLNKGGFFQEGSGFQNYNVWRGTGTNTDLYESTISAVIANITKQTDKMATFAWIEKITGTLYNKDTQKVEKAGRNIIKKPLTAMLFGSSVKGAVASMFREFIDTSYAGFEKIAKMEEKNPGDRQKELNAYADNLNDLLQEAEILTEPIPYNSVEEFLANFEFSESQEKALEEVFNKNLGEAVKKTMKREFSAFLDIRDTINTTANATFSLYDAAYQGIRQNVIKELIASGAIKAGSKKIDGKMVENAGDALHDLTADQEKLIEDRIAKLNPEVLTYMAKQSQNSEGAGLHISKSSRKLSQEGMYQNTSRFGTALPDTVDEKGNTTAGGFQLANAAYQRIREMPGVAMVPMMIHSLDSAISHMALMGRQVLNVHDAHGTGLKGFIETAHALNKATWKAVLHYSPAAEMRDAFKNTLMGMDTLLQSKENTEAVIQELRNRLTKMANDQAEGIDGEKVPMPLHQVLISVAGDMYNTSYKSDKTKYETMAQLQYVDQYALEGGQYEVTDADRAEAQALLGGMGKNTVPHSVWNAIDRINEVVLGVKTNTANSPYGELGKSSVDSDMDLVHVFEDQPLQKPGDVAKLIMGKLSRANQVVLRKAMKLVGDGFPIQMISSRTQDGAMGKQFNARGWFAYNGEKHAVYVLSPEFKASGLTPDLLVHELLHAALAKTINHPNTKEAKELVKSLESLVGKVQEHLDANPELKAKYGFKLDVHELVSWGMSDAGFQQDVLAQVPMTKAKVTHKAMSVMMAFIKAVSKFIGLPMTVKNAEGQLVDNGLASLIQDVAGLFEQAQNPENGKAAEAQSFAMEAIQNLSTVEVYEALDDQTISLTFDEHLRGLLSGIVTKLHGPFGTFKALVESKQASTPKELWDQAKDKGAAPFGSAALAAGIPMNDQVAFVLEQVEASVQGALEANTGTAHDVYVELNKLYQEAKAKLENSTSLSPALRDFLFKMDMGQGGRSRHLARFAALGLAHPEVNAALKMGTDRSPLATSGSFAHRLESLFQKVLEWFNGKLTHTFAGQAADEKLNALVKQLVEIEAKRKEPMLQKASVLDFVENSMKQGAANLKSKVEKASQSKWVRDRKNSIVRTAGAVVSTVAGDRVEAVMNHIQEVRDRQMNKGFGLAMGMVNEIRGMNDGNKMFHRLIREAKLREGIREDLITHTGNVSLESFANKGKDLAQEDKHAITAGLLRTDISALLAHHSMEEVSALLSSPAALSQEIKRLEGQLAPFRKARGFYERYAKNLAYKMVKGQVKGHHLLMNASNIAHLFGTGNESYVTASDAAAATPIIDQLVSLYAFQYTEDKHKDALGRLLASEGARTDGNGVEMVLKLHKSLQEQSKERLFEGSEALMMKGYVPEIYDPKKEVVVATEKEGAKLEAQGYIKGKRVSSDPLDPDKNTERFVYKRDGGGLRPWLSAIFSYTGETAKGSRSKTDNVQNLNEWKANKQDIRRMTTNKRAAIQREFRYDPNYDPSKVEENYAAPILNPQGEVTDYRYLMQEENKDDLLNRDSRFDKVLGFFAGNIYDKESTKESNRKAVEALREQYLADFATRSVSYRQVGPDSEDMELQDIYRMLPEDTKQAIKEIWGTEYMMVRSDLMDINFGYRKTSVTDAFHKERKNALDAMFVGLMTHVMGEKAEYNLRRAEDIWQEIVAEAKEILVIKNLSTLLGNIGSNISLLYWHGVPIRDMARYHRIALKGVSNYRQDSAALIELETQLAAGYIKSSRQEMEREIIRLKDALEHNPVKELIDAGLMPSIVEDVSPDDDMYSYKSRLVHYVDDHSSKLNKHVLSAAKTVYMAKDTQMYKALRHATQLSDFVARYALYAHKMSRKDNPMSKDEALQLASDSFVNYDLPSHRKLQYMNDMGFVMFTKYYLRIQKVIAHLYAENPGRALALLVTDHFFSSAPMLTDSGFTHKLGNNPFSLGALEYPGVLDELATIKLVK
jgi:hypothetical protein